MRRALSILAAIALPALLHCSSGTRDGFGDPPASSPREGEEDPPPGGGFAEGGTPLDASTGPCTEDIDVVLVLDVSSSMDFVLNKLDAEIDRVVTASNALKAGAHFGLVLFVDNVKLVETGDLSGGKVHSKSDTLRAAFADAKATYTGPNRNPGDGPSGPQTQNPICEENALDALSDTASLFPWRSNAAHVAIIVTDDTFIEKPDNYGDRDGDGLTNKTDFPREGNYPARFTLDETIASLKTKGIRVFSFSKLKPAGFLEPKCSTGRRHDTSDAITFGWSKPYKGKPAIPDQTGGKNFDLDAVRSGSISLADTINEVVLESRCAGVPK